MTRLDPAAVKDLVRLPAVLSVPGDTLTGAAWSRKRINPLRALGLAGSSSFIYLGGMALNDYADREIDAVERPQRPIPSGRIEASTALRIAQVLTAGGVALAGLAGGKRSFLVASALAAEVWSYDLYAKNSDYGPLSMAACRSLDVMLGTSRGGIRRSLVPALVIGAHTYNVTNVSRQETTGGDPEVVTRALVRTQALAGIVTYLIGTTRRRKPIAKLLGIKSLGMYVLPIADAAQVAVDEPTPENTQRFVGTGVLGVVPLQAALINAAGRSAIAGAIATLWPLAKTLSHKRSVT